ncbi:hypothetical protein D9615_010148 [Tricholomella constricta]|uniref:Nudix hydrolase domain-containing protein n=1 Tax=Tricholomella constricta TaxID=117010 RepID=A0A8H5GR06_9AGAR|nr:hypothetical protein D9615_010148 [Tricholomella constricta]
MSSKDAFRSPNLLKYHRPKLRLNEARIPPLSQQSKQCLRNLVSYQCPNYKIPFPRGRSAAVLVALFVGRMGDLYVLLSRRSATLRTYAGDTSLPGGKADPEDATVEDTARREAFEEIGLPRDRHKVPLLCILEPFLAANATVVTPVVVLILDNTLRPMLNDAEVASLFSHPLASFLTTTPPFPTETESLEVPYYSYNDWTSSGPNNTTWTTRAHRFLTGREAGGIKPVFGLTASIMIRVAMIGYGHQPEFDIGPPGAPTLKVRLAWAMLSKPEFRGACEKEGLRVDWDRLRRLAGVEDARMPAPAVYILAVVGAVAAGIAFKEFVYEPHIAPKVEQWAEEFLAKRQARRGQRAGAVPVSVPLRNDDTTWSGRSKHSDSGDEGDERRQSIELEHLIAKEVREWQSEVNRSQTLRRRGNAGPAGFRDPSDASTTATNRSSLVPTSPTHVLFDPSLPSTPISTLPSAKPSPSPHVSSLREARSRSTLRSPPPLEAPGSLPTPAPSSDTASLVPTRLSLSPSSIPSLSQSYPQDLDHEHGIELLSAPSSRPDSPFSSFSQSLSVHDSMMSSSNYYSFSSPNAASPPNLSSPQVRPPSRSLSDLDFLSDFDEHDPMSPLSAVSGISSFDDHHLDDGTRSEMSGSSWASAGVRNR